MKIFAQTDIGKVREINQDYYYISEEHEIYKLCVLADGMGGYTGGEIASQLAAVAASKYIEKNFVDIEEEDIEELIKSAMEYANEVVYAKAKKEEELEQMGTTLEICLIYNNKVFIGHIGDSRIYLIRKSLMTKITTDHSYVQELIEDGTITKEEAIHHPRKNMLTKAIGCEETVEPDTLQKELLKDDIILMCSDGLTNMITEEEIAHIVKDNTEMATQTLINKANSFGGYDNITIILIRKEG